MEKESNPGPARSTGKKAVLCPTNQSLVLLSIQVTRRVLSGGGGLPNDLSPLLWGWVWPSQRSRVFCVEDLNIGIINNS